MSVGPRTTCCWLTVACVACTSAPRLSNDAGTGEGTGDGGRGDSLSAADGPWDGDATAQAPSPDSSPAGAETAILDGAEQLDFVPNCEPGSGCFMEPCTDGSDCKSGICAEYMGDPVCTQTCIEECPQGWDCKLVPSGADPVFACISSLTHLCRPCFSDADCDSALGVEDVCIHLGPQGDFCGAACSEPSAGASACPAGFSCKQVQTVGGGQTEQCVPDSGECPCSKKAAALALGTRCQIATEYGICGGKRFCGQEGLGACDASVPVPESCNGKDDDCDGEIDDVSCADAEQCTQDSCGGDGGCIHEPLSQLTCDDGNPCTEDDVCSAGTCVGIPIDCDDGNLCTYDTCEPAAGCIQTPNWDACDDGDPCTAGDSCKGAACQGFPVPCACKTDADCQALEDGNLCNGTLSCEILPLESKCSVTPGTEVICPDPEDAELPDLLHAKCLESVCDPLSGKCSFIPANDGYPCDDSNACTYGSVCSAGQCTSSLPVNCADGSLCTNDWCDETSGCAHEDNSAPCSDGDVCSLGDICSAGACQPGPDQLDCDDKDGCTSDSCEPLKGCVHAATQCDDANPCTTDACLPSSGTCIHVVVNAACDPCTYSTCDLATGIVTCVGWDCDDSNLCTADACDPAEGAHGLCRHELLSCADSNPCTDDTCDPAAGCVFKLNTVPCDDADACTFGEFCTNGSCSFGKPVNCLDGNQCTDDTCDSAVGCTHTHNTELCSDGDPCTVGDACALGECSPGSVPLNCDDVNPCTTDSCLPGNGCKHEAKICDDGDLCTADFCDPKAGLEGTCQNKLLQCFDGEPCTDDWCAPETGCVFVPNAVSCDDGDPCTDQDTCSGGSCSPGLPADCDDSNPCTEDVCTAAGCAFAYSGACTIQPGPADGMDHVIGSVYNIDPNGTMDHIRTGGWGDNYWALLQFPTEDLPPVAKKATVRLFGMNDNISPTQMYLDRVTSQWAENCSWGGKPSYTGYISIPPSQVGVWYEIVITDLYNGWKSGAFPNYGVQLRSYGTWNNYNGFWSSDYAEDPSLRPMLVVEP